MKFFRILPETCASTRCLFSSSTRNIAFGSDSTHHAGDFYRVLFRHRVSTPSGAARPAEASTSSNRSSPRAVST